MICCPLFAGAGQEAPEWGRGEQPSLGYWPGYCCQNCLDASVFWLVLMKCLLPLLSSLSMQFELKSLRLRLQLLLLLLLLLLK
jgi:hypothetical protein